MNVMPNGPTAYFDVDDTLIMWDRPDLFEDIETVRITTRDMTELFTVNTHNVEYLKRLSVRGHAIVVWSAGGSDWAEAVIKALALEEYVWAVCSKPTYYIDDLRDPKKILGKYRYYDKNGNYITGE